MGGLINRLNESTNSLMDGKPGRCITDSQFISGVPRKFRHVCVSEYAYITTG